MTKAKEVITRFAPSPTGYLHIGGARTALFNWLFARANGGKFLLRIEDTDRERSDPKATEAIYDGMKWLGLDWDGDAVSQFSRVDRHVEVANKLLKAGAAYKCFSTREEIDAAREIAKAAGKPTLFESPWRDVPDENHPNLPYVIRLKTPKSGKIEIDDVVQGPVSWNANSLEDLILLRSDQTPTYMLAVVVDDHDMGVTHVIRGDDHLTNKAKQSLIYQGMGWDLPVFAHIPLIHGPDGAKLSKRHGALGIEAYRDMGLPAVGLRNYLARLSWSHGDDEFITTENLKKWFTLEAVGKAPARLDFKKMANICGQHIKQMPLEELEQEVNAYTASQQNLTLSEQEKSQIIAALPVTRKSAKNMIEIIDKSNFYMIKAPIVYDDKAQETLLNVDNSIPKTLTSLLQHANWNEEELEQVFNRLCEEEDLKLGQIMKPLRPALSGRTSSPSVFDMMLLLGKDESINRINDAIKLGRIDVDNV